MNFTNSFEFVVQFPFIGFRTTEMCLEIAAAMKTTENGTILRTEAAKVASACPNGRL